VHSPVPCRPCFPSFQKNKNQVLEEAADEPRDDRHPSIRIDIADHRSERKLIRVRGFDIDS
jgi:hypothetical protein